MSMLDSFFNKGFKASKCKTLLKLTIPRIKLLRNRREVQIKQMRHDIAKLLETGQEATARIRVEHIVREEKMMAAQEIVELFSELISVRLPIIEAQRECPLDLKEAISSICFAAPRCADLPELQQVQLLFASKYGKEFVAAATELRPDCGVNRKLVELLSVRAPSPEEKLKLLNEIAEEHELDWDPAATETEFSKSHEDLLEGSKQFLSGSKLPLPEEKNVETPNSTPVSEPKEQSDADTRIEMLAFPEVPKELLFPNASKDSPPAASSPVAVATSPPVSSTVSVPTAPVTAPTLEEVERRISDLSRSSETLGEELSFQRKDGFEEKCNKMNGAEEDKPVVSEPYSSNQSDLPPVISKRKTDNNVDLQEVLAKAKAAAETAERAAAEARSAATLAESRVAELTKKDKEELSESTENPFHTVIPQQVSNTKQPHINRQDLSSSEEYLPDYLGSYGKGEDYHKPVQPDFTSFERLKVASDMPAPGERTDKQEPASHQPHRLPSMDEDPYFPYPNLFSSQHPQYTAAGSYSIGNNTKSSHDL